MKISATDALLIIDAQNDFLPGGALAVIQGDQIIAPIKALFDRFDHIIMTQDWHPQSHISFASSHNQQPFAQIELPYGSQILWPDQCVIGSSGAELALIVDKAELIIRKGFHAHTDSYSAFLEADRTTHTGLAGYLKERGFKRVFLAGLATDFCVAFSALDAAAAGFGTFVIEDCCRAIDHNGSLEAAWNKMFSAGVQKIASNDLR